MINSQDLALVLASLGMLEMPNTGTTDAPSKL